MRGEIRWSDYNAATAGIQRSCETLLNENLLRQAGVSDVEMDHDLGEDGGVTYRPAAKGRAFVTKKTVAKRTSSPNGPASEDSVTIEGEHVPHGDPDPEGETNG